MKKRIMKFADFGARVLESADLDDVKWILIELSDSHKLIAQAMDGDVLLYELSEVGTEDDIQVARLRLEDLGYDLVFLGPMKYGINRDKAVCWIVKSGFFQGDRQTLPFRSMDEKGVDETRGLLLKKIWDERPYLHGSGYRTTDVGLALLVAGTKSHEMVAALFREYLGADKIREIFDSALMKKELRISEGGYDFRIKVEEYEMLVHNSVGTAVIRCSVLNGGEVTLFSEEGEPTMWLEEAVDNPEFGWEINNEIHDCIERHFCEDLRLPEMTGYLVHVVWHFE